MDGLLELIDALRNRGAIEITARGVSVKFAGPVSVPLTSEPPVMGEPDIKPEDIDRLLYMETSKL